MNVEVKDSQELIDDMRFKIETLKPVLDLAVHEFCMADVINIACKIREYEVQIELLKKAALC